MSGSRVCPWSIDLPHRTQRAVDSPKGFVFSFPHLLFVHSFYSVVSCTSAARGTHQRSHYCSPIFFSQLLDFFLSCLIFPFPFLFVLFKGTNLCPYYSQLCTTYLELLFMVNKKFYQLYLILACIKENKTGKNNK